MGIFRARYALSNLPCLKGADSMQVLSLEFEQHDEPEKCPDSRSLRLTYLKVALTCSCTAASALSRSCYCAGTAIFAHLTTFCKLALIPIRAGRVLVLPPTLDATHRRGEGRGIASAR